MTSLPNHSLPTMAYEEIIIRRLPLGGWLAEFGKSWVGIRPFSAAFSTHREMLAFISLELDSKEPEPSGLGTVRPTEDGDWRKVGYEEANEALRAGKRVVCLAGGGWRIDDGDWRTPDDRDRAKLALDRLKQADAQKTGRPTETMRQYTDSSDWTGRAPKVADDTPDGVR